MSDPDLRLQQIHNWLENDLQLSVSTIAPASSDASFRRYFRTRIDRQNYIIMDAPPQQEDLEPFLKITRLMSASGINVPMIHQQNTDQGFLLLEDFGRHCYLDKLNQQTAPDLYHKAMKTLLLLQQNTDIKRCFLPEYDYDLLNTELELFRNWFVQKLLDQPLTPEINQLLDTTWQRLIDSALEQPKVCVHRDYHSRNLMHTDGDQPGVIDFQDAVVGPITYDLVSLLRDCYITWPEHQVTSWVEDYHRQLLANQQISADRDQFHRWFDLMGLQRHLKAIGIFARLKIRDNKHDYVKDIPRTMNYVTQVCQRYPEFDEFHAFLKQHILPVDHLTQ